MKSDCVKHTLHQLEQLGIGVGGFGRRLRLPRQSEDMGRRRMLRAAGAGGDEELGSH